MKIISFSRTNFSHPFSVQYIQLIGLDGFLKKMLSKTDIAQFFHHLEPESSDLRNKEILMVNKFREFSVNGIFI